MVPTLTMSCPFSLAFSVVAAALKPNRGVLKGAGVAALQLSSMTQRGGPSK